MSAEAEPGVDTVVWDMGGIFRDFFTEAMLDHGRAAGWPVQRLRLGPTGMVDDPQYVAMGRGDLGEHAYLDGLLADLAAAGIDFDPLDQPSSFFPDRPATWKLIDEVAADPGRRQAILTNDASRWLGERWWETWPQRDKFVAVVDSRQVGTRKPDRRMYDEVLAHLGADARTCVFVDDMPINVDAARAVGMHGVVFDIRDPADSIERVRAVLDP